MKLPILHAGPLFSGAIHYPERHYSSTSGIVIDWLLARMPPMLDDAALPPGMVSLRCIDPVCAETDPEQSSHALGPVC